ncbi:MAG: hypothetical protein ACK4NF_03630 [Planctomycetota bacterium]
MGCPEREEIIKIVFGHSKNKTIISHIEECSSCLRLFNEYKTLWNTIAQLQAIEIGESLVGSAEQKLNIKSSGSPSSFRLFNYIAGVILCVITSVLLILYFSHNEQINNIYDEPSKKIISKIYKKDWFARELNALLTCHEQNINATYKQYFMPFIERIYTIYYERKTELLSTLYELAIFSYFFSQELKIRKILDGYISRADEKILDNILYYISYSQNSDGGIGIESKDERSLPQVVFWVVLFVRNYIFLRARIPETLLAGLKKYVLNEKSVIGNFVNIFLFNKDKETNISFENFEYVEQFLAYQYIKEKNEKKRNKKLIVFM